jgi:hypothetical protein
MHDQQWNHANKNFPELLSAAQFFAANQLQLQNVTAVRLGRCLKDFPPAQGYTGSMVISWSSQCSSIRIVEPNLQDASKDLSIPLLQLRREWDDWPRLRVMQFLLTDDVISSETAEDVGGDCQVKLASPLTLPEQNSEDCMSTQSLATHLRHDDPAPQCCLQNTDNFEENQLADPPSSPPDQQTTDEGRPPLAFLSISPNHLRHREEISVDPNDLPDEAELVVHPPMTAIIADLPAELRANSIVIYNTSTSGKVQREVVPHERDVLCQQQIQQYWTDSEAAIVKELQTLVKLNV